MSFPKTLRFHARGTALVPNYELLLAHRTRAYVGRVFTKTTTPDGEERHGFLPTKEPSTVPFRHEYAKHCRDGELWAADEATAKACGVKFDPKFGDEGGAQTSDETSDANTSATT